MINTLWLSDGCLSQDLSVSDVEEEHLQGEKEKRGKEEKGAKEEEEEHSITCSECREFSLTAF